MATKLPRETRDPLSEIVSQVFINERLTISGSHCFRVFQRPDVFYRDQRDTLIRNFTEAIKIGCFNCAQLAH